MAVGTQVISMDEIDAVLSRYRVAPLTRAPQAGGGTANANWKLDTEEGPLFLKKRHANYALESYAAFDHTLMAHLADRGIPAPAAVKTASGDRWLALNGAIYELFLFRDGEPHDRRSSEQIRNAGAAIGRFHKACAAFERPDGKDWPRYDSPAMIRARISPVAQEFRDRLGTENWYELHRHIDDVEKRLTDERYHSMPKLVIHGDYHPGNVTFVRGQVAGIFDFDWSTYQPRIRDVADGVFLFAGERAAAIDARDIVSLTQTWTPSSRRARIFLNGYLGEASLTLAELDALPLFLKARWLSCRAGGMAKVSPGVRASYFASGLLGPLRALDESELP